jgi:hypothetical protein
MNRWFLVASVLTILIGFSHSWLGERYLIGRLLKRQDLPRLLGGDDFTKRTLRFAWHLTTLAWLGMGGLMAALARLPADRVPQPVVPVLSATFAASALLALVGSRGRHLSWVVFLAIAVLLLLGLAP